MEHDTYQLSPRIRVSAGETVKVDGMKGYFRFRGHNGQTAELIGPLGGSEGMRTVALARLRAAEKAHRGIAHRNAEVVAISERAKARRRA